MSQLRLRRTSKFVRFQAYSKFHGISPCTQAELRLESVKNYRNNLEIRVEKGVTIVLNGFWKVR